MSCNGCHRAAPVLAGILLCIVSADRAAIAHPQGAPGAATQETLKRVGADVFGRGERLEKDVQELKSILANDPRSAEAHFLLGIAYRRLGAPELVGEARAELRQALDLNPGLAPARYYLAEMYLDVGRLDRAREELEIALKQGPGQPQFLALLGETERRLGNPDRSAALNRQALQADASFQRARYYLGLALFDLGKQAEAIQQLEQIVSAGPAVIDVYLGLGTAYIEAGRVDDALKALGQATRIDPSRRDVHLQLARAHRSKGLLARAEEHLKLAGAGGDAILSSLSQADQQLAFTVYLEQGLLRLQQGRVKSAIDALRKVLDMDPQHGPANRGIAEAYLRQGLYKQALEHASRAETLGFPLPADKRTLLQERLQAGPRK